MGTSTKTDANPQATWKSIFTLAFPITMQSLFQSSFSVIDQFMVGQLGTASIAAIGLGANFPNVFTFTLAAIGTAASIMLAQYCGIHDRENVNHSFLSNVLSSAAVMFVFLLPSLLFPTAIIGLYTTDRTVIPLAANYLQVVSVSFPAMVVTTMLSTLLRNTGKANVPMITGIFSVAMNTLLNYLLIFGNFGFPALGVAGSALATDIARYAEALLLFINLLSGQKGAEYKIRPEIRLPKAILRQTLQIASPVVLNEFLWAVGQTAYAVVYGRMGTDEMAAMTLTYPIQGLSTGLFSGISTAAAIMVGNYLGQDDNPEAYRLSVRFIRVGIVGSLAAGIVLGIFANVYPHLFQVSQDVKNYCTDILYVFAAVLFVKVTNMILGGGILRCGGKTKYTLFLDVFGTWAVGVPLGFLGAYALHLPVYWVYFMISLEEVVRLGLEFRIFKSRKWMESITAAG